MGYTLVSLDAMPRRWMTSRKVLLALLVAVTMFLTHVVDNVIYFDAAFSADPSIDSPPSDPKVTPPPQVYLKVRIEDTGQNRSSSWIVRDADGAHDSKFPTGVRLPKQRRPAFGRRRPDSARNVTWGSKITNVDDADLDLVDHERVTSTSTLLFVWCGKRTFRFKNYLSVKSAMNILKPRNVVLVYNLKKPMVDRYNTWFNELLEEIAIFSIVKETNGACEADGSGNVILKWLVSKLIWLGGGTYLDVDTLLSSRSFTWLSSTVNGTVMIAAHNNDQPAVVSISHATAKEWTKAQSAEISSHRPSLYCRNVDSVTNTSNASFSLDNQTICYTVSIDFHPGDIWTCDNAFCSDARQYVYGSRNVLEPVVDLANISPNVVHYIWYGGKAPFKLSFFLSVLSFLYIQKADKVYIHGDVPPHGPLWNLLQRRADIRSKIRLVYRPKPKIVYSQKIKVVEHVADITKADISFRYGGIIPDTDLILCRPLNETFRKYKFVVGLDIGKYGEFPDVFNIGFTISQPGNLFAKLWLESAKNFNDSDWLWNGGQVTYKIYENNPQAAYVSRHLQVLVYKYQIHATWHKDKTIYQNFEKHNGESLSISYPPERLPYAFHFTWPEPYVSVSYLVNQQGLVGDLGKLVLTRSNFTFILDNPEWYD